MTENSELVVVEEKTIVFYSDKLAAVRLESGDIYVPVKQLSDNLGLVWSGQFERIKRDEVLNEALKGIRVTRMPLSPSGRGGGPQEALCLPLKYIPGWLFGVNASRVRPEIKEKLIRYRREAYDVLWDAFKADVLPQLDPALVPPAADLTPAERDMVRAEMLYNLARQQVAYERWLVHHDARLDEVEDGMIDAHAWIDVLELTIAGGPTVTAAQAAAVSKAIKALAYKLGQVEPEKGHDPHDPRGGNPYPRVYSRLYRTFSVSSYKAIPLETFPAVMTWLADWWNDIADDPPPFGAHDVGGQLGLDLE